MANITVNSLGLADGVNGTVVELSCLNGELVTSNSIQSPSTFIKSETLSLSVSAGALGVDTVCPNIVDTALVIADFDLDFGDYLVEYELVGKLVGSSVLIATGVETPIAKWSGFFNVKTSQIMSFIDGTPDTLVTYVGTQNSNSNSVIANLDGINTMSAVLLNGVFTIANTQKVTVVDTSTTLATFNGKRIVKVTKLA